MDKVQFRMAIEGVVRAYCGIDDQLDARLGEVWHRRIDELTQTHRCHECGAVCTER